MTERYDGGGFSQSGTYGQVQWEYHNVRTGNGDGITHDSKREAALLEVLRLLERSGQISRSTAPGEF